MEAVDQLIQSGKVRYAGVSNYNLDEIKEACKIINIVSNQVHYSMIERNIETDLVPYSIESEKAILAYSPLGRGILSGKMQPGHKFADGDHRASLPTFSKENIKLVNDFLDKIKPLAQAKKNSLSQLVIRWTIDQPGITIALVGARNAKQAIQNAGSSKVELSESDISFINNELKKLKLVD
jgi:aryl-alcohol dehydrogenase-like predicted oxidoreductase